MAEHSGTLPVKANFHLRISNRQIFNKTQDNHFTCAHTARAATACLRFIKIPLVDHRWQIQTEGRVKINWKKWSAAEELQFHLWWTAPPGQLSKKAFPNVSLDMNIQPELVPYYKQNESKEEEQTEIIQGQAHQSLTETVFWSNSVLPCCPYVKEAAC